MTRHGTLVYYLAAWIIGCSVVALFCWGILAVQDGRASYPLLFAAFFFALISGAADTLLFGFILRRAMRLIGARSVALWSFAGAVLSLALVFLLAFVWNRLPLRIGSGPAGDIASVFVLGGPAAIWMSGWWQSPIEGAVLGAVLALIDRAFNPAAAGAAVGSPNEREAAPTS